MMMRKITPERLDGVEELGDAAAPPVPLISGERRSDRRNSGQTSMPATLTTTVTTVTMSTEAARPDFALVDQYPVPDMDALYESAIAGDVHAETQLRRFKALAGEAQQRLERERRAIPEIFKVRYAKVLADIGDTSANFLTGTLGADVETKFLDGRFARRLEKEARIGLLRLEKLKVPDSTLLEIRRCPHLLASAADPESALALSEMSAEELAEELAGHEMLELPLDLLLHDEHDEHDEDDAHHLAAADAKVARDEAKDRVLRKKCKPRGRDERRAALQDIVGLSGRVEKTRTTRRRDKKTAAVAKAVAKAVPHAMSYSEAMQRPCKKGKWSADEVQVALEELHAMFGSEWRDHVGTKKHTGICGVIACRVERNYNAIQKQIQRLKALSP